MNKLDARAKASCFVKLREVGRIMPWEDIKVGEIYHLPPLIYNKRCDFIVLEKNDDKMRIRRLQDEYPQHMFRTDVTSNFVVKKFCCNET